MNFEQILEVSSRCREKWFFKNEPELLIEIKNYSQSISNPTFFTTPLAL